jgi:aminoglycoside phosphotransferase (APT) family kinase protein
VDSWVELALDACRHAGVDCGSIEAIATWDQEYCASAVYRLDGERYLKVYGPEAEWQFHIERSVLRTIQDYEAIPAPRIVAEAERGEAPPYLIMTAVPGATAEEIWDDLPRAEQLAIARQLGEITAAIHRLPTAELAEIEGRFGYKNELIAALGSRRAAEIESAERLSEQQRETLLRFLQGEAREYVEGQSKLTHWDLAHNHVYLSPEDGTMKVSGIIDWGEALLGPPEWDVVYLWFWTFSGDREAMRECLGTLYAAGGRPDRFARRCLAAVLYTSSMRLLWPHFAEEGGKSESIMREMTEYYFPADVFGRMD